ncbi:uncharacterized protein LOC129911989 [Episyrphus balteatus]|uniref:uncharacterized protein LOC129911989 n=1 Tax=Episyrphus balteatus TaxID=286459 RepID=UPI00248690A1|nr:uncharacterized protein LOC129911989 [Episyrphus balteatus]
MFSLKMHLSWDSAMVSLVLLLVSLAATIDCWKPIVGHSTTYSLHQSHPGFGSQSHSINTLGGSDIPLEFTGPEAKLAPIVPTEPTGLEDIFGYNYQEPRHVTSSVFGEDPCSVKKYAFDHEGTVTLRNKIPELEQFTVCYWMRFTNHSGDHTLLTYSDKKEKRQIQFWIANSKNSSFVSMAIRGQQVYRLNYPLRTRQWHHICTSWNGKSGEWQVWLKAERIGRGFHNALVSHKIPANGMLFAGGPSETGEVAHGLHFELTLIQIYKVALSAGKAHRDHKHHHVHHFDHEGQEVTTTKAPPPVMNPPQAMNNLLANGQIRTRVRINFAQPTQTLNNIIGTNSDVSGVPAPQATINTNFVNGQFHTNSRLVAQQLGGLAGPSGPIGPTRIPSRVSVFGSRIPNSINSRIVDDTSSRVIFKRSLDRKMKNQEKVLNKRGLVFLEDGSIVDDEEFKFEGLAEFGGKEFKHDLKVKMNLDHEDIEDEIKEHDREPAEEEVKAVMEFCGNCDIEPFQGAIVFAWKNAMGSMDRALDGQSVGRCGNF